MPLPENAPNLIAFLKSLRAVRQFQKQEVPQDVLTAILDVARWSGSASNRQPWELIIVRDREMLQALAAVEGYVGHLAGAAVAIVLVMAGDAGQVEQETFDEGRLSERIMLAAAAYSVGASIGWFWGNGRSQVKHLLGIPQGRLVRTAISLGYPDREAMRHRPRPAQARKPLLQIVHWERYGNK
ncbi:MAG: nitroreductase family protein [Ktedonobacteraceae bacterium]|nr:nitroreductase family protein [Ktedonobacteraceae bacterium]